MDKIIKQLKESKLEISKEERYKLWKNINWGNFRLLDYFMYFKQSNANNRWCENNPGEISYLTATSSNNGVSYKVSREECVKNNYSIYLRGISITTDGTYTGSCFYQSKPFMLGSNVVFIKPKNIKLSKLQSLFICKMIRKESFRFNYGRKLNTDRLEQLTIGLPMDSKGNPDWDVIEVLARTSAWTNNL